MADDDDDDRDSDEAVREALRVLKSGAGATIGHVLTLHGRRLLPQDAIDAVDAVLVTRRDVANGGMDQVAWNHGLDNVRAYAKAWHAVGAIENAELLDRLAAELERQQAMRAPDEAAADPVQHFIAFRRAVNGPYFAIPEPIDEVSEALVEYVIAHADQLIDPDGELPPAPAADSDPAA